MGPCKGKCPKNRLPRTLGNIFYKYGSFVARHPYLCMIVPVLITGCLLVGLVNELEFKSDAVFLYVPTNAPSRQSRKFIQTTYAYDRERFFSGLRNVEITGFMQVIIEPKTGNNLMTDQMFDAITRLDDFIRGFKTEFDGSEVKFEDVCGQWEGACVSGNPLVTINEQKTGPIETQQLSYPYHSTQAGEIYPLMYSLSDVTTSSAGFIERAGYAKLAYSLQTHNSQLLDQANAWLNDLKPELLGYDNDVINVYLFNSLTIEQELESNTSDLPLLFSVAFIVLFVFSVLATLMKDGVRSKPWVAVAGMQATMLSMASSIGLMSIIGVPFASVVGSMPFLIVGK